MFATLIRAACWLLLIVSALAYGADASWWMDLFTHFRLQIACIAMLATLVAFLRGYYRSALAAIAACAVSLMPLYAIVGEKVARLETPDVRIVAWNVFYTNKETTAGLSRIKGLDADILILSETSPHWKDALLSMKDQYPYQHHADSCDDVGCQVSLMSKYPWDSVHSEKFYTDTPPVIWATFSNMKGAPPFHVVAVHLRKAITADGAMRQKKQTAALGEVIRGMSGPVIMAGDMNAAPMSAAFRRLVAETGLVGADISLEATWPRFLGPLGLAIDHFFATRGVRVSVERLGYWSSDHRMLEGRVVFERE